MNREGGWGCREEEEERPRAVARRRERRGTPPCAPSLSTLPAPTCLPQVQESSLGLAQPPDQVQAREGHRPAGRLSHNLAELHRQKQGQGVPQRSPCRLQLASQAAPGPRGSLHRTTRPRPPTRAGGGPRSRLHRRGWRSFPGTLLSLSPSLSSCPLCPRSALASEWVTG